MKLLCVKPDPRDWWPLSLSVHTAEILAREDGGALRPLVCLTEVVTSAPLVRSAPPFHKMLPPPQGAPATPGRFGQIAEFFEGILQGTDEELQLVRGGGYKLSDLRTVSLVDFLTTKFAPCPRCGSRNHWARPGKERYEMWHCDACARGLLLAP